MMNPGLRGGIFVRENKSMTWFTILINFVLFASAFLFLFNAYYFFSGALHQKHKTLFYWMHPTLKALDIIMGILFVSLAVYTIYTRIQLIKFSALAPKLLPSVYLTPTIMNAVYLILLFIIIGFDFDTSILSYVIHFVPWTVLYIVLVWENKKYIDERSDMFVN